MHEVMLLTQDLQHLIVRGSAGNEIRNAAIQAGMETGLNQSLELLVQGITTLEEVERTFTRTPLV
ncbi:MAG: hypothetical protein HC852_14635 [Acaryochloridaceae cyanobacterium RU_4_10]|nr:hypothetical protein [Acaryochloridaceae cyanobacterium RU_4_10]